MIEDILDKKNVSAYQPSSDVIDVTKVIKEAYSKGIDILYKPWVELNNSSIVEDQNRGQMMFNSFVDTSVENEDEGWKFRGTRSTARNKAVAMHANITANFLLPTFIAQNEDDEVDKGVSEIMRDLIEWLAEPTNSNYQSSFLQVAFSMMTNPVTYLEAGFYEVMQNIKIKNENGKVEMKEVLDEVLSGFKANIYSATQVLITNAYERNIQKQTAIIKRKYVDYNEMEAKYGEHENWMYVQQGIKSIYNEEDGLFYDVFDDEHPTLVAEETYYNRREDLEIPMINGIYMGDSNTNDNPIKHRDNYGCPKYNLTPFGYSRINEHFFYYKSMMNILRWNEALIDSMNEIAMNMVLLQAEMPMVFSGTDKVDSEVVFPNAIIYSENADFKATPLLPQKDVTPLFKSIAEAEGSMEDSSTPETISGALPEASQKAYNVSQAQAGARKIIGEVGKSLAESIIQFGGLMKDIVINHITIPEIDELVGDKMKLKYKTFTITNKESGGKVGDKIIKFDEKLIGSKMTKTQIKERNLKLLEESGYPEKKNTLTLVNPEMFSKFKYLCKADVEEMFTKNQDYWQPILSALYGQLANDPLVDRESLLRKLLYSFFQSDADDFIADDQSNNFVDKGQGGAGAKIPDQITKQLKAKAPNNITV